MEQTTRSTIFYLTLVSMLLLAACGNQPSSDVHGTITISGAWALYPMMTRWAEAYSSLHPGVRFDISAGGAGKGMADALGGAVDIGMVSREITAEEEAKGAFWVAVTEDAVFPVVNAQNPVLQDLLASGVDREIFTGIYITGDITQWGQIVGKPEITDEIHVYTRSDAAGAPETWAKYLGKTQEDLLGIGVFGDPGLLDAVIKDPLGIGYNNLGYAFDLATGKPVGGAVVLPVDVNENSVADPAELLETRFEAVEMVAVGKYPSPPARPLNVVTNGKPSGIVLDFIRWILTEGQVYVDEAGYVHLSEDLLANQLAKLR